MDQRRFETALRALERSSTRRQGLAAMAAVLLGAEAAEAGDRDREPRPGREERGKRGARENRPEAESTCGKCRGCCAGVTCQTGTSVRACGKNGATCKKCAAGQTCEAGSCVCTTRSCTGCCTGNTCNPGTTAASCGKGGLLCKACSGTTPVCCNGTCRLGKWTRQTSIATSDEGYANSVIWATLAPDALTTYVTDKQSHQVMIWTRPNATSNTWTRVVTVGEFGSGTRQLFRPSKAVLSQDQRRMWISDTGNHRVSVWTRSSATSTTWTHETSFGAYGSGTGKLNDPRGLSVSGDGLTVLVADRGNRRIRVWTRSTSTSTTWNNVTSFGTPAPEWDWPANSQMSRPHDVVLSQSGLEAVIIDKPFTGGHRMAFWTRPTSTSTTWTVQTNFPGSSNDDPYAVNMAADGLTAWISHEDSAQIAVYTRPAAGSVNWTRVANFELPLNFPSGFGTTPTGSSMAIGDTYEGQVHIYARGC